MKLFTKYNRINVISTVIIFLLGCAAFSMLLRYVIISQVDEDLKIEKNEVLTYVKNFKQLPAVVEVNDQYTVYTRVNKPVIEINKIFTNKVVDKDQHQRELRRTIEFDLPVNNIWYLVSVSKSLEGADELIQSIIIITVTLILLILIATFIINRIVLKKLWQPFYTTLHHIKEFKLSNSKKLNFNLTNIDEFTYLNSTLTEALYKAQNDYQALKEFTENASHELQTPLAVIHSKLDILIQNEKLSENESNAIQSAYHSLQGLSKLNQSLLLLTKIENNQFDEKTDTNIAVLIENKTDQFNELWKAENINVRKSLALKTINSNIYLIEILLNNLLSNATKHNFKEGFINIVLNDDLQISNTGIEHSLDEQQLFKRFSKQNNTIINHGLGLYIIWQICQVSGFACRYNFTVPNIHSFIISFNKD